MTGKAGGGGLFRSGDQPVVIIVNGYLGYIGARDLQVADRLEIAEEPQMELTRSEYLRLLSPARLLRRDQAYLLVKVFGNS